MNFKYSQLLLLGLIALTLSCGTNNKSAKTSIVYVYNPSDEEVKVKIDNEILTLPPFEVYPKALKQGKHFINFGVLIDDFEVDTNSNLLINPLRGTLISEEIAYLPNNDKRDNVPEEAYTREFVTLNIHGLKYHGPLGMTNNLFIRDWSYGPGHPVNLEITEQSHVKVANLDSVFTIIKYYTIPEFKANVTSVNHTEEYIKEVLPNHLKILAKGTKVEIRENALFAGAGKEMFELAKVYVSADEKLFVENFESYDTEKHGKKLKTVFTLENCTVRIDSLEDNNKLVNGIRVSKGGFVLELE